MTTYRAIPSTEIDAESPGTEQLFTALANNPTAITEGATGAPKIQTAAYDAGSVNQAALKTTTHAVSTTAAHLLTTLNGGEYGFWVNIYNATAATRNFVVPASHISDGATYTTINTNLGGTYVNRVTLGRNTGTLFCQQRYIQACPPYNNGPFFIFGMIDNNTKNIESISLAVDPPWANNGPTNIRPDFYKNGKQYKLIKKAKKNKGKLILPIEYETIEQEITMDYKDSDVSLIPHPFQGNDLTNKTIIIIEPGSDLCCELYELHETGENINELFHGGYFILDNKPLTMKAPPECMPVKAKWKLTN